MAQQIGVVLSAVMKHAAQQHGLLQLVQQRWRHLVGSALAGHAKPTSIRRGVLVIVVSRPGDSFALSYQREALVKKLAALTEGRVKDIVVRPGG